MRRLLMFCLLAVLLPSLAAAQADPSPIQITGAWARPALAGNVSAVYLNATNSGDTAWTLVSAAAPAAAMVEIHESRMVDNVMQMRPVEGIEIAPGAAVTLAPGGLHIMLMNLKTDLTVGDAISVMLEFNAAGEDMPLTMQIGVPVLDMPPAASDMLVLDAWARPTARLAAAEAEMSGMTGSGCTPCEIPRMPSAAEATATPGTMGHGHGMMTGATPTTAMSGHSMGSMATPAAMPAGETRDLEITSSVSAVYLRLLNQGATDDRLIRASTDAAGVVEIHETRMQDGVMQMRPVEGVAAPVGEAVALQPGGLHIMLLDVQRGLVPGDAFMITLEFESGLVLPVAVTVRDNNGM